MSQFEVSEALKEKLDKAETLDEVLLACNEEGVEITKGDLEAAADAATSDQLTESDLENVAGGCAVVAVAIAIYAYWKFSRRR